MCVHVYTHMHIYMCVHVYMHVCTCIAYVCVACIMKFVSTNYSVCVIISSRVYSVSTLCASSLHCNSRLDSGSTSRKDELSGEHFQGKTNYTRATYVHNHSVSTGVQNVYLQTRVPTRAGDVVFQVHLNVVYFINITIFYKSTKK